MIFSVSGLPRSGTAWCSTFFSLNPYCIGVHELATANKRWREELEELDVSFPFVADCTTYECMLPDMYEKRIWIHRDPNQCLKSSQFLFGDIELQFWDEYVRVAEQYKSSATLVIEFDELFTEKAMMEMWYHVFPKHMVFPKLKAMWLARMNVQRHKAVEVFTVENCQTIL